MRMQFSILNRQLRQIMPKTWQERKLQICTSEDKNIQKQLKFIGKFIKTYKLSDALSC
jgi:hypothetical protein